MVVIGFKIGDDIVFVILDEYVWVFVVWYGVMVCVVV